VEIVKVDLQTGTHQLLLLVRCPDTDYENPFQHPILSGALAAVTSRVAALHIILDWEAQSFFIVKDRSQGVRLVCECPQRSQMRLLIYIQGRSSIIALVPGHILLKPSVNHPEGVRQDEELRVISHDALIPHFRGTNIGVDGSAEFNAVSSDQLSELLTLSCGEDRIHDMSVHASPLRADEHRVWLYGWNFSDNKPSAWCSRLCITSGQWRVGPHLPLTNPQLFPKFTYAGHLLTWTSDATAPHWGGGKMYIRSMSSPLEGAEVDQQRAISITPYSGAMTYFKVPTTGPIIIVIKYYK
jgi:hypothetical protein